MTAFNVWEFRVRYHLKKYRDTKTSRKALRVKFGKEATPLIDALLAQYDTAAAYRRASVSASSIRAGADVEMFLQRVDFVFEGEDGEPGIPTVSKDLKKPLGELVTGWHKLSAKMRAQLQPYHRESEVTRKVVTTAHTKWQRAVAAAKHEHAKLSGLESET